MQQPKTVRIVLRAMEPADIDAIYSWENNPSLWGVSAAHQPFSRQALQRFIDESSGLDIYASRQLRLMACDGSETVGCVDLYDFDPYHRRAGIGIMVDGRLRHRGYGAAMLAAVEEFARQHLALHQLYSVVANDNHHSISLFGKAGYAPGGTLKEWTFADGRWVDATMYQKIIEK